ncbi:helix-turn-helix domain-containing protein [Ornithinimicrobium pratense]|uniref:helix-turn-helix domain-containing protein n=1 Tax=Ornithinimicrobium pratense TaxID=2593973 RepID=UPI00307E5B7A
MSDHRIVTRLEKVLMERKTTLTELSRTTGITMANLSIFKSGHAKAVRFSSLTLICGALHCAPGDLLDIVPKKPAQ